MHSGGSEGPEICEENSRMRSYRHTALSAWCRVRQGKNLRATAGRVKEGDSRAAEVVKDGGSHPGACPAGGSAPFHMQIDGPEIRQLDSVREVIPGLSQTAQSQTQGRARFQIPFNVEPPGMGAGVAAVSPRRG